MPKQVQDLIIWQVAREVTVEIYRQTRDKAFDRDPDLRAGLRRAASAILANIAVGYDADTAGTFARAFDRAAEAAAELSSLVHLTKDLEVLEGAIVGRLLVRIAEISRLIGGWKRAIRAHRAARRLVSTRVN